MPYLLGLDVSTTGSKALIIREDGKVMVTAVTDHAISTPKPLWSEQDPGDWWKATLTSIKGALNRSNLNSSDIAAVGLSGQMHGLVLVDAEGNVLRPAILWNDQRTGAECAAITERIGFDRLLEITGNPVLPGFTAPKLEWVRRNEPEVFERVAHVLLPKDYIRYRLTGEFATDVSDASGMSLLDVGRRRWSGELLEALEIPAGWMPRLFESVEITGEISGEAGTASGLRPGTPVVAGGGDQAAGAVGSGIVQPGNVLITLGTSGVVFAQTEGFTVEKQGRLHAFCHAVPDAWHVMGVTLSAAGSFRWYRDTIGATEKTQALKQGEDPYDLLTAQAEAAPPGAEGLLFLPYLSGERTPHPDPNARGVFFGLTNRHDRAHLVRSVLEGVAFSLRDCFALMREARVSFREVLVTGGGAKSGLWRRILADVLQAELTALEQTEGASYGAALLAGTGAGVYSSIREASEQTFSAGEKTPPQAENRQVYDALYDVYRGLYQSLKPHFDAVSRVESGV